MKKLLYILLFIPLALFGQENYSLSFDGVDDWLEFQSINLTGSPFTIEGWIKVPQVTHDFQTNVVDQYTVHTAGADRWGIYIGGVQEDELKGKLYACTFGICDGPKIDDNTWHNFAFVRDGNGFTKMFLDGVLVNNGECPIDYNLNSSIPLRVNGGIHQNPIDGSIGRFMDFSLSNLDISLTAKYSNTYNLCDLSENSNPILHLEFNADSWDTIFDLSGNENHGTVYGATFSEDVPEQNCDESSLNELSIIDQLNQSFDAWNVSINLSAGWNMFGYGCPSSIDVAEGLSNHTESIIITKDNNGNVYMPEFGFNGIGDFTPGFGYQIKLTEAIEGFSLCHWYVNDIPEDNIVSLQEEVENLNDSLSVINSQIGCTDSSACNFNPSHFYDNGSCEYPEQGYDCDGNINVEVGVEAFGGIVFYVDETGERGLIAAMEDLSEGASDPYGEDFGYEWGCYGESINGLRGTSIGTGFLNTLDIVNQGCSTENGGITAAQAAIDFEINGFSDWYLPALEELIEIYNTIGNGGSEGNIGSFNDMWYWSSSEYNTNTNAWYIHFNSGVSDGMNYRSKFKTGRVRVIRAFGNWTMGCMDSLACNYNPEANMADGSCEYAEDGYDCQGNELQFSLSFDGIDDYLDFGNNYNLDLPVSFSFDVKINDDQLTSSRILSSDSEMWGGDNNYWGFAVNVGPDLIEASYGDSGFAGGHRRTGRSYVNLDQNIWHNIRVVIIGPQNFFIYVDGDAQIMNYDDPGTGGNVAHNSWPFILGAADWGNDNEPSFFNGNIDNFEIWNKGLTPQEIHSFNLCHPTGNEDGLIGYWDFNEGEGDTVYDLSGNENHGTINGASYSTDTSGDNCE